MPSLLPTLRLVTTAMFTAFGLLLVLCSFVRFEFSDGPFTAVLGRVGMAMWWGKEWHLTAQIFSPGPLRWRGFLGAFQAGTLGDSWFINARWIFLLLLSGVLAILVRVRKQVRGFPVGETTAGK